MPYKVSFVTSNKHKFSEAKLVLGEYGIELVHIPFDIPEIQSTNIKEIVINKVLEAIKIFEPPLIVEDAALHIEALNGFPGPYASYVYNTIGLEKILGLLRDEVNRRAVFVAVGAVVYKKNIFKVFSSQVDGLISHEMRGDKGFGYDPIFIPEGHRKTFAEMETAEKNMYSHRGKLFRRIGGFLTSIL